MPPKKDTKKKSDAEASDKESKTRTTTKDQTKESKDKDTKKEKKEAKAEKKDDVLAVDRGDIEKVLDQLTNELLKELLLGHNMKKPKNTPKKNNIKEILDLAAKKGQATLFANLDKDTLKAALETLSKEELDHDNKSKMLTDVKKHFSDKGHKDFFKALNKETLVKFAAALEFEEEEASKEELENALEEEILIAGLREVLNKMAKEFIVDAAKELNLAHSGSKKAVETRILAIAYPHLADEEDDDKKKGEKKEEKKVQTDVSKINKDSTFEDLYQYYQKDLHDWCESNGLKKTGTKKDLIHRMLKFFKDPEDKTVKPQKKGEKVQKKKKKSEAQKKKEAKEKREAKKKEAEASGDKKDDKKDDKKGAKKTEEKKTEEKKADTKTVAKKK